MNKLDKQYTELLKTILDYGVVKKDRTGTGTKSIFGYTIRHNMKEGFPLLTTKKMYMKGIIAELLWFLNGDTNIKYLVDNDCHIWDGDVYKRYIMLPKKLSEVVSDGEKFNGSRNLTKEEFINKMKTDDEFSKEWGELGPIYGKQWRSWGKRNVTNYDLKDVKGSDQPKVLEAIKNGEDVSKYGVKIEYQNNSIDQIQNLINDLKTNPDSRRLMVSAWNVGELDQMVLPPCHYGFQVYTRELSLNERIKIWDSIYLNNVKPEDSMDNIDLDGDKIPTRAISLMWNQRSVDTFLGLPFNIASYGLLLEIIAKEVNMVPEELIGNLGDTHLYLNHLEQAQEQIGRLLTIDERIALSAKDKHFDPADFGVGDQVTETHMHNVCDAYKVPRRSRIPFPLPTISFETKELSSYVPSDFKLLNYQSHPAIKADLSN